MTEIWKDIKDFEGLYQVSNTGKVRSLSREIINKNGAPQYYPGKLLKIYWQTLGKVQYGRVTLSKEHIRYDSLVHRLVANAYLPKDATRPFVNHIDNDPSNNAVSNLEWCTHEENMQHAQDQGRLFDAQSAGGKAGSAVNKSKMLDKHDKLRGTSVNSWKVLDKPIAFKRGGKYYAECECSCGKESNIELGRLVRKEATACRSCNSKWKNR